MKSKFLYTYLILLFAIAAHAQDVAITHGPYIQAVADTEVTVVWTTDADAVSWVEVAPAGTNSFYNSEHPQYYETRNGNRVEGRLHKIKIPQLKEGTEYRYRVFSKAVLKYEGHRVIYGNIASTNVYRAKPLRFRTLNGE